MKSARKSLGPHSSGALGASKKPRRRKSEGASLEPISVSNHTTEKDRTDLALPSENGSSSPSPKIQTTSVSSAFNSSEETYNVLATASAKKIKRDSVPSPQSVPEAPLTSKRARRVSIVPAASPQVSLVENGSDSLASPLSSKKKQSALIPPSPQLPPVNAVMPPAADLQTFPSRGVVVQRCRFVTWQPAAVTCLAFNSSGSLVAVGRESGDVEIWNVVSGWFCERVLSGSVDFPVRNLHWIADEEGDRLLSTGTQGIIEWDLLRTKHKAVSPSYGGSVNGSCIRDTSPSDTKRDEASLALACEDGSIRIFSVGDSIQYIRALHKHDSKALSVSWVGNLLVSGGADGHILIWECTTWTQSTCIFVEAGSVKEPTSVWQVKIIPRDLSIVSGDSLGHVQVWESKFGTLLQSFAKHQADVLSLALANGGRTLFAAGVDTQMVMLNYVSYEGSGQEKWVVSHSHRSHTHDVTALAVFEPSGSSRSKPADLASLPDSSSLSSSSSSSALSVISDVATSSGTSIALAAAASITINKNSNMKLATRIKEEKEDKEITSAEESLNLGKSIVLSGSMDCQIAVYTKNMRNNPLKVLPFRPVVSMGCPSSSPPSFTATISSSAASASTLVPSSSSLFSPVYLLIRNKTQLQLWRTGSVAPGESPSVCTPQEYLLRINTAEKGRTWNLIASAISPDGQWIAASSGYNLKLYRYSIQTNSVEYVEESKSFPASNFLAFTPDSHTLVCAGVDQRLAIVNVQSLTVLPLHNETDNKTTDETCVTALAVSADSRLLAVADHAHNLTVFDLQHKRFLCALPSLGQATIAMAFQPGLSTLVVVSAKNEVFAFDTDKNQLSEWSRQNSLKLPQALTHASDRVFGITFNPAKSNQALLVAGSFLCSVDLNRPAPKRSTSVVRVEEVEVKAESQNFHLIQRYSPILSAQFCSHGLVIIEVPWFKVMQGFPAAFKRQKYGT